MAVSPDRRFLYPMLEGPLTTESEKRKLLIHEFDTRTAAFTTQTWSYRLEAPEHAIGELTQPSTRRGCS